MDDQNDTNAPQAKRLPESRLTAGMVGRQTGAAGSSTPQAKKLPGQHVYGGILPLPQQQPQAKSLPARAVDFVRGAIAKTVRLTKDKAKELFAFTEKRYGRAQAVAIFGAGQLVSWGTTGVAAVAGVPVYVPSAVAMLPFAAAAELGYQAKKLLGRKKDDASKAPATDKPTPPTSTVPTAPTAKHLPTGNAPEPVKRLQSILGRNVSESDIPSMVGAPADANVKASTLYNGAVQMRMTGPGYSATRSIRKDKEGKAVAWNQDFYVTKNLQGKGLGREIFAKQVDTLGKMGVDRIETSAAGGKGQQENGYYTWPRMGYDGPLKPEHTAKLPAQFQHHKTVQSLLAAPGGREAWKEHGSDINLAFDLKQGSQSRRILDQYREAKRSPSPSAGGAPPAALAPSNPSSPAPVARAAPTGGTPNLDAHSAPGAAGAGGLMDMDFGDAVREFRDAVKELKKTVGDMAKGGGDSGGAGPQKDGSFVPSGPPARPEPSPSKTPTQTRAHPTAKTGIVGQWMDAVRRLSR